MPPSDSALLLDHQLCFALYSASRALTRAYAPRLAPLGITYPQYLVMLVLWEELAGHDGATGGVPMGRLGERLELDSGTLTPLLKRLSALGYVERRRGEADERQVFVHLTSSGRRLREQARGVPKAVACAAGFTGPSRTATLDDLARLRGELRALTERLSRAAG